MNRTLLIRSKSQLKINYFWCTIYRRSYLLSTGLACSFTDIWLKSWSATRGLWRRRGVHVLREFHHLPSCIWVGTVLDWGGPAYRGRNSGHSGQLPNPSCFGQKQKDKFSPTANCAICNRHPSGNLFFPFYFIFIIKWEPLWSIFLNFYLGISFHFCSQNWD